MAAMGCGVLASSRNSATVMGKRVLPTPAISTRSWAQAGMAIAASAAKLCRRWIMSLVLGEIRRRFCSGRASPGGHAPAGVGLSQTKDGDGVHHGLGLLL